jgi:hypothetical protein
LATTEALGLKRDDIDLVMAAVGGFGAHGAFADEPRKRI